MREGLSSIFYVSRALVSASQVDRIVLVSRRNNMARGITGGMVYTGRYFAQMLEGEADAVTSTMRTMSRDTRHDCITYLFARPAFERTYKQWTMGFVAAPSADQMIEPLVVGTAEPETAERLSAMLLDLIQRTTEPA